MNKYLRTKCTDATYPTIYNEMLSVWLVELILTETLDWVASLWSRGGRA